MSPGFQAHPPPNVSTRNQPTSTPLPSPPFLGTSPLGWPWPIGTPDQYMVFSQNGSPVASPRHRAHRSKHRRDQRADSWQQAIRDAARRWLEECDAELELNRIIGDGAFGTEALQAVLVTRRPRAKGHLTRGVNARLKPDVPLWPVSRPDIDNYAKAVYDALGDWRLRGSMLYKDDAQIVGVTEVKRYVARSEYPGMDLAIAPVPFSPAYEEIPTWRPK